MARKKPPVDREQRVNEVIHGVHERLDTLVDQIMDHCDQDSVESVVDYINGLHFAMTQHTAMLEQFLVRVGAVDPTIIMQNKMNATVSGASMAYDHLGKFIPPKMIKDPKARAAQKAERKKRATAQAKIIKLPLTSHR